MVTFLEFSDLSPLAPGLTETVATIIIDDIEAKALLEAPCIEEVDFPELYKPLVKAILRRAALRWARAGEGGLSAETLASGPFSRTQSIDTRSSGEDRLWPSEIKELQKLCRLWKGAPTGRRKAFTVLPGRGRVIR